MYETIWKQQDRIWSSRLGYASFKLTLSEMYKPLKIDQLDFPLQVLKVLEKYNISHTFAIQWRAGVVPGSAKDSIHVWGSYPSAVDDDDDDDDGDGDYIQV